MYAKKNSGKKVVATLLAIVLLMGVAIGGTIAYLMDATTPVVNTFTPAEIEIKLEETPNDVENKVWTAQLVPGKEYTKDPVVSVVDAKTDIDCYLFVRVEKTGEPDKYLEYTSLLTTDAGWTLVPNTTDVWYRIVYNNDTTQSWHLLSGDKVTVKSSLEKADMPTAGTEVKLTYEAYAIQYASFENNVEAAWTAAYAQKNA